MKVQVATAASKVIAPTALATKKSKRQTPARIVIYGPQGVGKSTFAANAPRPVVWATEDGLAQLDVDMLDGARTLEEFYALVPAIQASSFETFVIDTLDRAELLVEQYVCQRDGPNDFESYGYGKGYKAAADEWVRLLSKLESVWNAGKNIVLVAHSHIRKVQNPEGQDYDRFSLRMHERASGLVRDWCDAVLFARYEEFAVERDGKVKGVASGRRVIHSERRAAFEAKNRYGLPPEFDLSWEEFDVHRAAGDLDEMRRRVVDAAKGVPGEEKIRTFVESCTDRVKLGAAMDRVSEIKKEMASK